MLPRYTSVLTMFIVTPSLQEFDALLYCVLLFVT